MSGPVRSVGFSWCGGYIVAGGEDDRGVEIAHVESGEFVAKIEGGPAPVVQWSPKDYSIAYALSGETAATNGLRIINGAGLMTSG
jgi:THO complex subunit 3